MPLQIALEREGQLVRGRIDVLVVQEQLWVLVIESKQASFSLKEAIPQALSYMVTAPYPEQPVFGFITNGSHFLFLKLQRPTGQYALSDEFSLFRRVNELYTVLQVLQRLGQTMTDSSS